MKGRPEMVSAADAPTIATMSESLIRSCESTVQMTCVSLRNDLTKSGLSGRSMRAGDQGFLLAGPPFALEETAGNLAGGECLLLVVDREREEVLPFPCRSLADDGAEHRRFAVAREDGAIRLAGDAPGFEDELAPRPT